MADRPLSPHLQIYRWRLTMALSILHRMTGIALAIGTLMVIWMLLAAATGMEAFAVFTGFAASTLGQVLLLGWTAALFYHMCNGIRHLFWDMGKGFSIPAAYRSGYAVIIISIALTVFTWVSVLDHNGVLQ